MKNEQYKIVTLFGKGGAGKDTLCKELCKEYQKTEIYNNIISCTTRPKRDYEQEGKDYFFLTNVQFAEKINNGTMLEATFFNNNCYGTPIEALNKDKINIGVFNIKGIECLLNDSNLKVCPIYIDCNNKELLFRMLNREFEPNCHEICRRFLADEKDFFDIPFDFNILDNSDNKMTKKIFTLHSIILDFFKE